MASIALDTYLLHWRPRAANIPVSNSKILEICYIKFGLNRRHSSLAYIAWNQNGLVHTDDEHKQKFGRP